MPGTKLLTARPVTSVRTAAIASSTAPVTALESDDLAPARATTKTRAMKAGDQHRDQQTVRHHVIGREVDHEEGDAGKDRLEIPRMPPTAREHSSRTRRLPRFQLAEPALFRRGGEALGECRGWLARVRPVLVRTRCRRLGSPLTSPLRWPACAAGSGHAAASACSRGRRRRCGTGPRRARPPPGSRRRRRRSLRAGTTAARRHR